MFMTSLSDRFGVTDVCDLFGSAGDSLSLSAAAAKSTSMQQLLSTSFHKPPAHASSPSLFLLSSESHAHTRVIGWYLLCAPQARFSGTTTKKLVLPNLNLQMVYVRHGLSTKSKLYVSIYVVYLSQLFTSPHFIHPQAFGFWRHGKNKKNGVFAE